MLKDEEIGWYKCLGCGMPIHEEDLLHDEHGDTHCPNCLSDDIQDSDARMAEEAENKGESNG